MVLLAAANRQAGNIVALTGEGADEALAGYVWFKWRFPGSWLARFGNPIERLVRQVMLSGLIGGGSAHRQSFYAADGIRLAQQISWEIIAQSRERLYSAEMWRRLGSYSAYDELSLPYERMRRWHPLNQSLYAAYKVMLPGMLLSAKGDRALRTASTEGRYPFLDEKVVDFCAKSRRSINCAAGPTNGCCGGWPTASLPLNFAVARRCFAQIWARRFWDRNDPFGLINFSVVNL